MCFIYHNCTDIFPVNLAVHQGPSIFTWNHQFRICKHNVVVSIFWFSIFTISLKITNKVWFLIIILITLKLHWYLSNIIVRCLHAACVQLQNLICYQCIEGEPTITIEDIFSGLQIPFLAYTIRQEASKILAIYHTQLVKQPAHSH